MVKSLAYDIGTLFHKVSSSLDKHSDQVLHERLGVSLSQFRILLVLLEDDDQKQAQIAENLSQSEPSISRQIRLLQDKKLINVQPNKASKRERIVFLTGKGAMIGQSAVGILNSYHKPMFEDLSEEQETELAKVLYLLQSHLEAL